MALNKKRLWGMLCAALTFSTAWANDSTLAYDDAITHVSQFKESMLSQQASQELAMFIANVSVGVSQRDVDALLGAPYSVEHLEQGERWDYNISIPSSNDNFMGCQFRIEFDAQSKVRAADWRKSICDLLYRQAFAYADQPEQRVEVFTLMSDVLFSFNRYQLSDSGMQSLDRFIKKLLARYEAPVITITGHTDRLGTDAVNLEMSKLRAREVGNRFKRQGVPETHLLIKGMGETSPVVLCDDEQKDSALLNCLAPNRRVEIEVYETP